MKFVLDPTAPNGVSLLKANTTIINGTSSNGGGTWGSITGDLPNQTDLQSALDDKQDILSEGAFVNGDKTKLDGIESLAEVNNISDANATDLTDGGATTLHKHDHGLLDGLADDDHTQYALLAGRSGGQTLSGGTSAAQHLTFKPNTAAFTSTANPGYLKWTHQMLNEGNFTIDWVNSGFLNTWGYNAFDFQGVHTVAPGGNIGGDTVVRAGFTTRWTGAQVFSAVQLFDARPTLEPIVTTNVTDNSTDYRMFFSSATLAPSISTASTWTGAAFGGYRVANTFGIKTGSHASGAVVMPLMYGFSSAATISTQATVTSLGHFIVADAVKSGTGSIGTQIGLEVAALAAGTTNIGVRIAKANTYSLQLSGTDGTAASGITFGTDTNLYRSAANTLKTDDTLDANTYSVAGTAGVDGSFTTVDGKTVTVSKGIITQIL